MSATLPEKTDGNTPNPDWFALLNQLSRTINLALGDFDATLKTLSEKLMESAGVDAVAMWTVEPETQFMTIRFSSGLSDRYIRFFNKTDRIRVGHGLVGRVISEKKTIFVGSFSEYGHISIPRWNDMVQEEGMASILAAPMFVGESLVGALNIYYKKEHVYSDEEVLFNEVLANHIAVTLKNIENYATVEKDKEKLTAQVARLVGIQDVVQQLNAHLTESVSASLPFLGAYLTEQFSMKSIQIFDLHTEAQTLSLSASHGNSEAFDAFMRDNPLTMQEGSLVFTALREKQFAYATRVYTDTRIRKELSVMLSKEHIVAMAVFPLLAHDRLLGVLAVYYDHLHEFSEEEISVLRTFSQFLAIAIEDIRTFQSLSTEKRKTESMVYSLQDGLIVYDLTGTIIAVNPRAEALLRISKVELLGLNPKETPPKTPLFRNVQLIAGLAINEYTYQEIELPPPLLKTLRITAMPMQDESRTKIGLMHILHDITHEKMIEHMKSNFVSTASHQLRTPLTGIRWGLARLASEKLSSKQTVFVTQLLERTEHVIDLVNRLLNVTRLEEGRADYQSVAGDILQLLRGLAQEAAIDVKSADLTLVIDAPKEPLPSVSFDSEKISIALKNLIENAIKYTPAGGTISLVPRVSGSSLIIDVRDTGIGIPKDSLQFLFNKFYRAPNAMLRHTVGTGLGLYLTKKIIEQHGGRITVDTAENKGTTFTIQLPLEKVAPASENPQLHSVAA